MREVERVMGRCHFYNRLKYSGCTFVKNVWLDVFMTANSILHPILAFLHPLTGKNTSNISAGCRNAMYPKKRIKVSLKLNM